MTLWRSGILLVLTDRLEMQLQQHQLQQCQTPIASYIVLSCKYEKRPPTHNSVQLGLERRFRAASKRASNDRQLLAEIPLLMTIGLSSSLDDQVPPLTDLETVGRWNAGTAQTDCPSRSVQVELPVGVSLAQASGLQRPLGSAVDCLDQTGQARLVHNLAKLE